MAHGVWTVLSHVNTAKPAMFFSDHEIVFSKDECMNSEQMVVI